jgi:eukaryotic-like serine/threonine-protein kinase
VTPEQWQQVERVFHDALEREPRERAVFLEQACGEDTALRNKINALLRSHESAGSFLKSPASPVNSDQAGTSPPRQFIGQNLGSYEVKMHIGSGGMGDVYRAHDTQLRRDVAIKVLPLEFSRDPDRAARFQREAVALAALNHPNIAAIHDLDEINGTRFLVLEFVEGQTLAAWLKRGPLPVHRAAEVCSQVAQALECAHAKGIQHRDLKPDNIQITPEDRVKLLDFGLAKILASEREGQDGSDVLNLTRWDTKPGVILGTAPYLSPEQARGQQPDKRSDIWAFGCVLFETLTGRQAFPGETVTDVFVAIVKSDPDWSLLPPELPESVRSLLRRCLQKEAKYRLHDIALARMTLEDVLNTAPHTIRRRRVSSWIAMSAVALLAAGLAAAVTWSYRPSATVTGSPAPVTGSPAAPLPTADLTTRFSTSRTLMRAIAISPDAANVVYSNNDQLRLRRMPGMETFLIPGTAGALNPEFSPDGQWLAFWTFADRSLKKVALSGGAPITLCSVPLAPSSLNWEGDTLVYASDRGILAVSASGGQPEVWIPREPPEIPGNPQILDGGDALLFSVTTGTGRDRWDNADIFVFSRKTGKRKLLFHGGSDARYLPTGHIVYVLGNTLYAVPFDMNRQEIAGSPVPILESVLHVVSPNSAGMFRQPGPDGWPFGAAQFDFSSNGTLVYVPDAQAGDRSGPNLELRVLSKWFDEVRQRAPSR